MINHLNIFANEKKKPSTLISAILDFFCQSHTVNMWSLQSSITLRCWPESWREKLDHLKLWLLAEWSHTESIMGNSSGLCFSNCEVDLFHKYERGQTVLLHIFIRRMEDIFFVHFCNLKTKIIIRIKCQNKWCLWMWLCVFKCMVCMGGKWFSPL